ncbi:MAG: lipopolysaccharide assembly protein LapA domain-containing protein [Peptostreptococcaceae bacterium]|nr:lipopolysaccharide assembly protein LapA domain-containing protein [Peptostreptococcaceae bacterium]
MSRLKTVLALIVVVLVVIFAVQNHAPVQIDFLMYHVSVSHALVIVLSAAIGVIVGLIVGLNSSFRESRTAKELNKKQNELQQNVSDAETENQRLTGQVDSLNQQIVSLNAQIESLQAQLAASSSVSHELKESDFNDSIDALDI